MQPAMSCSCLCVPALCGAVLAGAVLAQSTREGDIASLGVSGPQAGLAAVASVWLPLCSLCFPEAESDDIIKSFVLSQAKSSAQAQVALSSHCNLISGVSQKQSSSPCHSSSHSPSKDPSILGVPGVLLVSLPPAVQEIGWDLCHHTVTKLRAQSPGLFCSPRGLGSLLGQTMPLPGMG